MRARAIGLRERTETVMPPETPNGLIVYAHRANTNSAGLAKEEERWREALQDRGWQQQSELRFIRRGTLSPTLPGIKDVRATGSERSPNSHSGYWEKTESWAVLMDGLQHAARAD